MIPARVIDARPYADKSHTSSVEGEVASAETPSRGPLLHKVTKTVATAICALGFVAVAKADAMLDSIEQGNAQLRRLVQEIISSGQAEERARQAESQRAAARANTASTVSASVTAGSESALTFGELPQAALDRGAAIQNGNWERAVYISRRMLLYNRDDAMAAPINAVRDYVYLFFCHWNMGDKTQACGFLREGINFMKSRFGNDCDSRARVLLAKAESGELSGQFTSNDIMGSAGIGSFILELPTAVSDRHHAALMNQIQASTDFYRKEGEWLATHAKFQAKREYEDKYHRSFDPTDRPPEGSQRRDDWDSCKRIYDIFCTKESSNPSTASTTFSSSTDSSPKPSYGESNQTSESKVCRLCGGTGKKEVTLLDADTLSRLSPDEGRAYINALYHPECSACNGKGIISGSAVEKKKDTPSAKVSSPTESAPPRNASAKQWKAGDT